MLPELGHSSLVLATLLALLNICLLVWLQLKGDSNLEHSSLSALANASRRIVLGQWFFVTLSLISLALCFVGNDFSVAYVVQHSNILLPLNYKISAVWGGHEGSLLLWLWILCLWTSLLVLVHRGQSLPLSVNIRLFGVLGFITLGFLLFILLTSNPFDRVLPVFPMDGQDLNPLLQDFGLIVHPPMLYMGYVGFAIPFAFAVSGLLEGEFDRTWAAWAKPWAKAAWAFLTIGIALGSWWAYYELGWGGWWFWDPVENASFMPWLAGIALIHSLLACEKRNGFRIWTVLISIICFSLSLLGTFMVRSGVLTSVHSFASDPSRGLFILIFLALVVGISLLLFFLRAGRLQTQVGFSFFSKEFFLLLNNIFLLVACSTVLLGTLFPIITDVFNLGKISVGPPYFNSLFFPLTIMLLVVMAVVPELKWGGTSLKESVTKIVVMLAISVVLSTLFLWLFFLEVNLKVLVLLSLCLWSFFLLLQRTSLVSAVLKSRSITHMSASEKNMHVAHFGFLVSLIGIGLTSIYSEERDVSLGINEQVIIAEYTFSFSGVELHQGPNYIATRGEVKVTTPLGRNFELHPEKRHYYMQQKPMTEAAINPGFLRDIYVALGEDLGAERWSLRIYYKPFVRWIWLGALIMGLSCLYYVFSRKPAKKEMTVRSE